MKLKKDHIYLGDSVYIGPDPDAYHLIMYTDDARQHRIYLDPDVEARLLAYLQRRSGGGGG